MRHGVILIIGLLISVSHAEPVAAQADSADNPIEQSYKNRYTRELFDGADTNGDGYVSWNEARESSLAIERDRAGRKRFNAADVNNDGMLSIEEAKKYKGFEIGHREGAREKAKSEMMEKRDDSVVESETQGEEIRARHEKKERAHGKYPHRKDRIRHKKAHTRRTPGDR